MPFKNATKATNATNANIKPTPLVETYDMVVVAKHNLEVSNTTRHYKINIFSLNKTTIPIAQTQCSYQPNKYSCTDAAPTNKTAVSTKTTDPSPSLSTKAIRPSTMV
jgi:hypothetical protein